MDIKSRLLKFMIAASLFGFSGYAYADSAVSKTAKTAPSNLSQDERAGIVKQVQDALLKYGGPVKYGFQDNAVLAHNIIGFYDFKYQGKDSQLVAAYTKPAKNYNCHICAPKLSFFVFDKTGKVLLSQLNALEYGQWGNPPDPEEIQSVKLGADTYGFTMKGGGTGQGWTMGSINYYLPLSGKFQLVLHADTFTDNGMSGSESVTSWDSTISYKDSNSSFFKIAIDSSGVKDNQKFKKQTIYTFDGKKYSSVSEKQ